MAWKSLTGQSPLDTCMYGSCPAYEISLKNDYILIVGDTINKQRVLQLKGPGINTTLRKVNLKTSNAVLGWLHLELVDYFIWYSTDSRSFPSEQPLSVHIYEKETGKLVIQGPLVGHDESGNAILFIDYDKQEQLGLFDLQTSQVEYFPDEISTLCQSWWWCITKYQVTKEKVILDYHDAKSYTQRKILDRKL